MPMIDLTLPEHALAPEATAAPLDRLTGILIRAEGVPDNARARSVSWAFATTSTLTVGGAPAARARYRVVATVPHGALDERAKSLLVAEVTEAVLAAEGSTPDRENAMRVWCLVNEVPEGSWGAAGRIARLEDIATFVLGDAAAGKAFAASRLGGPRPRT